MFSIIVLLHEYGHYKTAKIFWIHVEEFWLWIPPRAKKLWKNKDGTLFSLNWIPLGWFVKISGESEVFFEYYWKSGKVLTTKWLEKKLKNHDDIFDKKGTKIKKQERKYIIARLLNQKKGYNFYEKNIFKSAVLLAGVVMNFLFAAFIFSILFFVWIKPVWMNSFIPTELPSKLIPTLDQSLELWFIEKWDWVILYPIENSIAEKSWIQDKDILLHIDDIYFENISDIQSYIQTNKSKNILFYIKRNDDILELYVTPNSQWRIWTYLWENLNINESFEYKYWLINSIKHGFLETYYQTRLTFSGLKILILHIFFPETPEERTGAIEQVAGPIWIVSVITQSLEWGFMLLIVLWAIISINLWVFNLLPIPALDWGRLLLLWIRTFIDTLFWKTSLSWNIENFVHIVFFLLLIALSVLIAYNDIMKLL
jgi:regulator of sigma E protease